MNNNFIFKKKYGQNFLIDQNVVKNIVSLINDDDSSLVIEIGCGDGKLTCELCKHFSFVFGYEIDVSVQQQLQNNLFEFKNYEIIFDDFLNRNILDDIKNFSYKNVYIISNLPYYITTPIIMKIINSKICFQSMILMVQKEFGDRLIATPGSREYGSLTVYLNYFFNIKKQFLVSRNCFVPSPNVDSVVISFSLKNNKEKIINYDLFFKIVIDAFQFKRKTLKNNLKNYDLNKILKVLENHNLDLSVRAEDLSLEVFCEMANCLSI